jgi:hypothetical protein
VEKSKARFDMTGEELERLLIQKEGESYKDTGVRSPGGAGGKRVIGKAVAKGGLLLKGRNPGNVTSDDLSDCIPSDFVLASTARRRYPNEDVKRLRRLSEGCDGNSSHPTRILQLSTA